MTRALGTDDSVTTCDCCGKSNLKSTVIIELDSGEIVHYGSVCAGRNTNKTAKQINSEIRSEHERKVSAARKEIESHPAEIAYSVRLAERDRVALANGGVRMLGREAMEFVRETSEAAGTARASIAAKFGLSHYGF